MHIRYKTLLLKRAIVHALGVHWYSINRLSINRLHPTIIWILDPSLQLIEHTKIFDLGHLFAYHLLPYFIDKLDLLLDILCYLEAIVYLMVCLLVWQEMILNILMRFLGLCARIIYHFQLGMLRRSLYIA